MIAVNLNSRIINEPHVAADHYPATTAAYRLGAYAAQLGEICCPESMFVFIQDKRDYCKGYASVAGATLTTVQFLGGKLS